MIQIPHKTLQKTKKNSVKLSLKNQRDFTSISI